MKAKIVGFRNMSFTGKNGGTVDGIKIHYVYEEYGTTGQKAENAFISRQKIDASDFLPYVGQEINIEYNRYGKIQEVYEA